MARCATNKCDYDLALELYEDFYAVIDQVSFMSESKGSLLVELIKVRNLKGTGQVEENIKLLREFIADAEGAAPRTR